ncbi:alpha/beta hydrolase [Hymenobacter saemangeumensis]
MDKFLLRLCFLLGIVLPGAHCHASDPTPPRLSGQWEGPLTVPGGALKMIITIVPLSNGTYYAALDVPQQRISRMPVEVTVKDDDISFRVEQAGSSFTGKVLDEGATLSGKWQQPGLTAPLVLQRSTTPAATQAATKMRLTPPYREIEASFMNPTGRVRLSGTLTVPPGEGPFTAVVLLSDLGPQDREAELQDYHLFGILADYLTRRGIAVLRFDDRGVGRSTGSYATATTNTFVTDAQAALAFLRSQPRISKHHVGLIGHGEGANVALLAAAQPKNPDFVVSLAGYGLPGYDVLRRQEGEIMRLIGSDRAQVKAVQGLYERTVAIIRETPDNEAARTKVAALLRSANAGLDPAMARARATQLTSPWSRFFFDFNPQDKLAQVQCPVLLLNGTADLQVTASRNLPPLQKGLKRTPFGVDVHKLSGVNHWFQPDPADWPLVNGKQKAAFSPEGLEIMRKWLVAHGRPAAPALPVTVQRPEPPKPKPARPAGPRPKAKAPVRSRTAANPKVTGSTAGVRSR